MELMILRGGGKMRTFNRKGYGRIYIMNSDYSDKQVLKVEECIKAIDEYEYEYMPDNIIGPIGEYPETVYNGKFDDIDLDYLTAKCASIGIYILCYIENMVD